MNRTWNRALNKLREIVTSSHRLAPVMRFETYAEQRDKDCYHLIETNRETLVMSSRYYGEDAIPAERFALPDAYWACLHQGKIIGGSSVVVTSDCKMLYDLLASCQLYNARITDNGLLMLRGKPCHIGNGYFYSYRRNREGSIEKGVCLASNMSNNYYHFMFQVASKFYYLDIIDVDKNVPLLVDEQVLRIPQMKEVIDILNKDLREVIPLKTGFSYKVDQLFCISDPNIVTPNRENIFDDRIHSFAFDKKILEYLKTKILERSFANGKTYPKRVFLSRKSCNKRNINEDELKPILDKYGFEFVSTGEMDIFSQARLFNQAEHIIGSSGAAFTNILFCSEGVLALLFISYRHNTTCYSSLAAPIGVNMMFIAGNGNSSKLHSKYYEISPEKLEQYLQNCY